MTVKEEKYLLALEALLDISILLNSELDSPKVMQSAILTCLGQVTSKFGVLYIREPLGKEMRLAYQKGLEDSLFTEESLCSISENAPLMELIHARKRPFFYDKNCYKPFKKLTPKVIMPLFAKDNLVGVMVLGEKYFGEYAAEDLDFLNKFAMFTSNAIENALLYSLATKDSKTGLFLHHYFMTRMGEELYKAQRYNTPFSLVMIDIDHFKKVNDTFGHQAGDLVLEQLGKLIIEHVRTADLPCRFGGEEFAIVLTNTPLAGAMEFAERLRADIQGSSISFNGNQIPVTASFGLTEFQKDESTKSLIEKADQALYQAKHAGRNRVLAYQKKN